MYLHEAFARALIQHELTTMFGLMGDGNLFMVDSYARMVGTTYIPVAHEASAVLMAHGYACTSGRLGVATVTHGPALTNTITPLVEGSLGRIPMLVIAGDTAATDETNVQDIPQREFVLPTGAGFEQVGSADTALHHLATAIRRAHLEERPIVLNVPIDFWWQEVDGEFVDASWMGDQIAHPDPNRLDTAVGIIASAKRPVVLAGRGVRSPDAGASILALADRIGAPLATTVKAKDLFQDHPFNLGVFGSLGSEACWDVVGDSDCIIVFGAGLNNRTTAEQSLLHGKSVIQVDAKAENIGRIAQITVGILGDGAATADSIVAWLDEAEAPASGFASPALAAKLAEAKVPDYQDLSTEETVDLRTALLAVDEMVPSERTLVFDGGRFAFSAFSHLHVRTPQSFVDAINFGSIGLGVGAAIGGYFGDPDKPVLLASGDGGFMMGGLTEFSTAVRHRVDLIVVVFNDGSYGAEHVQFTARGMDPMMSLHAWPDLAPVATALGGEGITVRNVDDLDLARKAIANRTKPLLIDIKMNPDDVPLPGH